MAHISLLCSRFCHVCGRRLALFNGANPRPVRRREFHAETCTELSDIVLISTRPHCVFCCILAGGFFLPKDAVARSNRKVYSEILNALQTICFFPVICLWGLLRSFFQMHHTVGLFSYRLFWAFFLQSSLWDSEKKSQLQMSENKQRQKT